MIPITDRVSSHFNPDPTKSWSLVVGGKRVFPGARLAYSPRGMQLVSVAQLRESKGYEIRSFRDLVRCIAELAYLNPQYSLLYRGQDADYKDKNGRSKVYPTVYRPLKGASSIRRTLIDQRYDALRLLRRQFRRNQKKISMHRKLVSYPEYYYALIQHYGIAATPLIDLAQSLRVAASFALQGRSRGYLLVFGMPHPQGSISHFVDSEMVLVKLQSVCPPNALRPHYQEGYLVGKLPFNSAKEAGDNLARRLIGKYHLINSSGTFWGRGFARIPQKALMPKDDKFRDHLLSLAANAKLATKTK